MSDQTVETKTAFGLTGSQVNYVIDKLNLKGCDYINGVLYLPKEHHDNVLALVKDSKQLKADVAAWENTPK